MSDDDGSWGVTFPGGKLDHAGVFSFKKNQAVWELARKMLPEGHPQIAVSADMMFLAFARLDRNSAKYASNVWSNVETMAESAEKQIRVWKP